MQKREVFTVDEAIKKLEYYCAYQERCHQEVVHKLRQIIITSTKPDLHKLIHGGSLPKKNGVEIVFYANLKCAILALLI